MKEPLYQKIGHGIIWLMNQIINFAVLILIVLMFVFGLFSILDNRNIEQQGDSEQFKMYKPTVEDTVSFEQLQSKNHDIFGWLTVDNTKIDYPLVQGKDNDIYINTAPDLTFSLTGSIFLDYRNSRDFSDFNSIIYGHHVEHEAMFGGLDRFQEKSYFDSHRYGSLFFDGKKYQLEVYAFISADAYDTSIFMPNVAESYRKEYLENIKNKSISFRELPTDEHSRLVILSTCSSDTTNGRKLLVLRLENEIKEQLIQTESSIIEEVSETVAEEVPEKTNHSLWLWITGGIILILLIFLIPKKKKADKTMEDTKDIKENNETVKQLKPKPIWKDILTLFIKTAVILLALYLLVTFVFGIHIQSGVAMSPSISDRDIVIYYRLDNTFKADETVIYEHDGEEMVGRVAAVSGDTVEVTENGLKINGYLQQNNKAVGETLAFEDGIAYPVTLKNGEFFILGDNRQHSKDSRLFGVISQKEIKGSVMTMIRRRDI